MLSISSMFLCFRSQREIIASHAKSRGAVLRITILRAFSLQKVIPRQGRKVTCQRAKAKLV